MAAPKDDTSVHKKSARSFVDNGTALLTAAAVGQCNLRYCHLCSE